MYQQFSALIFDMDGTLVDSGKLHQDAWSRTLNEFAIPVDPIFMRSLAGVPSLQTVEKLVNKFNVKLAVPAQAVSDHKQEWARANLHNYVKPTALADIAKQYHGQKPMAVGTGAVTAEAEKVLDICGLLHLMDYVVGADKVTKHKPEPDTFLKCAELIGVPPENCVVFEDAEAGLQAGRAANMHVVDVTQTFQIHNDYFLES